MLTVGQFIRQHLIDAGDRGVIIADLYREKKAYWRELGMTHRGGKYKSFAQNFYRLMQLGWVERVELEGVIYYRIAKIGIIHPIEDWYDLLTAIHPQLSGTERSKGYRLPTGRPRGRPRFAPPTTYLVPKPRKAKVRKSKQRLGFLGRVRSLFLRYITKVYKSKRLRLCRKRYYQLIGSKYMGRNRQIMKMRRQGLTLQVIGNAFGLTRERVRQIVKGMQG